MTERAYTVSELDALRLACENKIQWGDCRGPHYDGRVQVHGAPAPVRDVEEMVRTHMMAGHAAEDLIKQEQARDATRVMYDSAGHARIGRRVG